jgi:anti-anti-sigma factor
MTRFEATTSEEADHVRVALAGECDLAVREELTVVLLAAVHRAPVVVVDVGGLDFLDSSGVHGLITAHHAARDAGGKLFVVNPRGSVAAVLDLTGVTGLLSPPAGDGLAAPSDGGGLAASSDGDGLAAPSAGDGRSSSSAAEESSLLAPPAGDGVQG